MMGQIFVTLSEYLNFIVNGSQVSILTLTLVLLMLLLLLMMKVLQ